MKKLVLIILVLLAMPLASNAQSASSVFNTHEVTWFGVDFSNAKFIGPEGFSNPVEIVDRFFDSWNNLVVSEQKKYDIKKHFRKRYVEYDLSIVKERNSSVDPDDLVLESYESHELSMEDIRQIISEYNSNRSGLGLVFIVETFNKPRDLGTMYVTFFDIKTGKVLFTEKLSGKAGGIGLRNYWASSIHKVFIESGKQYGKWKKYYN
ncbi:MAG: hypothetical protein KGZ97_11440 [Bacteroidetes bacterium]|nr:hypothetical protein [Bacteroidota bacterium]